MLMAFGAQCRGRNTLLSSIHRPFERKHAPHGDSEIARNRRGRELCTS